MELLRQQIATARQSLFSEEILDMSQFMQLERLEDKDSPNFVEQTLSLYFSDATKAIAAIEQALMPSEFVLLDFNKLGIQLHRLKGSSASVGAKKVLTRVIKALECCRKGDMEGCKAAVRILKQDYNTLRDRLQTYFQLLQSQARFAET
ncbi:histidine-containing phosphotransfer protein 4-like [Juglans microcarpa x Juglans regia]|uniref:histidine-containing phosphotransfer protein 4-like n=1 Tax=Juglans microcarpa x Juglans regia TaxID=2249226 RepID=UPI001B7DD019|nr:histidine-containing phosphotransfer protein 4-like [Juglans microcarpa x Juglans regia]